MKRLFAITFILFSSISITNAQSGVWSGTLDIQGTKLPLVFHLDNDKPTMDSPNQGAKGIPINIERSEIGNINIDIPAIGANYKGIWLATEIVGTFKQMNVSLPLTLIPGENKPKRPQTPIAPYPYITEEVAFNNGDIILNGTLSLPQGYTRQTPALIMVTGSGVQNRDEELFDHKPFAVIADALARAGIATLRYDDRGFGAEISATSYDSTIEDFRNDALAGINLLRERFDNVGVIGHSEGGTIAMMLAAEQKADFIVSLAGMVISGAETLVWQNRVALKDIGVDDAEIESYCKLLTEAFNVRVNGGIMPNPDQYDISTALLQNYHAVVSLIQTPYMINFLSLDMRPLLKNISCPVLALNGTKDTQVYFSTNLDALRAGLPANINQQIEAVDGVNHLFQHCTTGAVTEYRDIEETFSPKVLDRIISWLNSL